MKLIVFALVTVPVLIVVVGFFAPEVVIGADAISASMVWTLIGTFLSYLGVIFAFFAVMEVRRLSDRYFTKQRLPDIKAQLEVLIGRLTDLGPSTLAEIREDRLLGQVAVVIRTVRKVKTSSFSPIILRAETSHAAIKAMYTDGSDLNLPVNGLDAYWNLFGAFTELVDEIEEYNKEAQASL